MDRSLPLLNDQRQEIDSVNPLRNNPLRCRKDLQQAVLDVFMPLEKWFSLGRARVRSGHTGTSFAQTASELEGFARPLWGLVPFIVGGGTFASLSFYHEGLTNGTDPQHPEYWGRTTDYDQMLVEMAALGFALAAAPQAFWEPLSQRARQNLVRWLKQINQVQVYDNNNWIFFRILVNLGLKNVGAGGDERALNKALQLVERFYLGDGWYSDGLNVQRDYYVSFAFHYYSLIYASLSGSTDSVYASRFRDRGALFAQDFIHWFSSTGAALPFGRSLSYRSAQGSFWGALAFADVESTLPWGVIKGLLLRHLRWWASQNIFNNDGTLSIGYAYPNLNVAEEYISPNSPYWALKIFLPLALPDSHPFWRAEEAPLPDLPAVHAQNHPGMVICSNSDRSHIVALSSQQYVTGLRHGEAKYAKFAYSTAFGFSVPSCQIGLAEGAYDSVLALSEDKRHFRVREGPLEAYLISAKQVHGLLQQLKSHVPFDNWGRRYMRRVKSLLFTQRRAATTLQIQDATLYSRWQPWPDVTIETWLLPALPWHVRIHHLRNARHLYSAEGGFALARSADGPSQSHTVYSQSGIALATSTAGWSGLRDLRMPGMATDVRHGQISKAHPNTNLLYPRTVIPMLLGEHEEGDHWLICAVLGLPGADNFADIWDAIPNLSSASAFSRDVVLHYQHTEKIINL